MKFIYKVLIGLLIFNTVLVLFSGFFYTTLEINPENVANDSTYADYKLGGDIFLISGIGFKVIGITAGAAIIGLLISIPLKSPVIFGAFLFSGLLAALYITPATLLYQLNPTGNWIIAAFISLSGVIIGVIAGMYIIEMFSGQGGTN